MWTYPRLALAALAVWSAVVVASPTEPPVASPPVEEASLESVKTACGKCHVYPPPESFPRGAWRAELRQAYDFIRHSPLQGPLPSLESVARFYESRAPAAFTIPTPNPVSASVSFRETRVACPLPGGKPQPGTTFVDLVQLDGKTTELLVCDAWSGRVMACNPSKPADSWRLLGTLAAPARATVVDLDGDGRRDLLVADLGYLLPTNAKFGRVVWLRQREDGTFAPIILADGVGRVADVQAADFRGTGKLDLVVAVFGGRTTGEVILLQNETTEWSRPKFTPRVLDDRHGSVHVPVCDLNGDGKPDFVALITQEHETVVAFLNQGRGEFRKETIYTAPHPGFGCSGIQMVDLNGDGRLDVLLSNGDSLDPPLLLKPYHGIRWLENRGAFPFIEHDLGAMPGVMRALAADVDGDGDRDIVAVSFLSPKAEPTAAARKLDSIRLLEQTAPGKFERRTIETGRHEHMTCVLGDWTGDGRVRLITGTFRMPNDPGDASAFSIWEPQKK